MKKTVRTIVFTSVFFLLFSVPCFALDRTISQGESGGTGGVDSLNLLLIVGLAIFISGLAQYLSKKGRRK